MKHYQPFLRLPSLALMMIILLLSSCKKDGYVPRKLSVNEAKEWYTQKTKQASYVFIKSTVASVNVKKEVLWSSAELYQLSDGTEVVGVPMNLIAPKGSNNKGNYFLLISNKDGEFKRLIVNDQKGTNAQMEIANVQAIESMYKKAKNLNLTQNGKPSGQGPNNSVMNYQEQVCIDWYYTETTYDESGNIIDYYEMYLWTDCADGTGNGGGGGGNGPRQTIDWGQPVDEDFSERIVPQESEQIDVTKNTHWYQWTFHRSSVDGWLAVSFEKASTIKVGQGPEVFDSVWHLTSKIVGAPIGSEMKVEEIDHENAVTSPFKARVKLFYQLQRTVHGLSTLQPILSNAYFKEKNFELWEYFH